MTPTTAAALGIVHADESSPPAFTVTRLSDGKAVPAVTVPTPYEFRVEGQPNSNLMRELGWYLEHFLDYPFDPEIGHAERVLDTLRAWGTQAFNALFDRRDAPDWLAASGIVRIRSDDPDILSWPWEALFDPQASYIAQQRRVERCLNRLIDPPPLGKLPKDRVNILLVVARPFQDDVRYRSIARPLVELIQGHGLPAHVDVLRPPTFDQLRDHLRAHRCYYHVLHFDGHGAYRDGAGEYSRHKLQGPQGYLVFENTAGEADPKSAGDLCALLREYAVPAVVLNACQSGMLDTRAGDAFASVATALLKSGMRSVVAMAYSLYVSGAQVFLPAFYRRLFGSGSVAEAVRAGRNEMLAHKGRVCARGEYPLEDWLLPVLYQQDPLDFGFARKVKLEARESRLPQQVREQRDPYGFIGRDGAILEMERALHRKTPAILVRGLGGVGKTTLVRGFLRWLDDTGGLEGAAWFDFRNIHTADFVVNQMGQAFYGENFGIAPNKPELLVRALGERRMLIVWDNFESASANLTGEDRTQIAHFLDSIRGARSKVIITSRDREAWLGPERRFDVLLGGLDGEERWEYCEAILRELGLKVDRDDPALTKLMDRLAGHPLAMRVVLPKLAGMPAAQVADALRTNIVQLRLTDQEEQRNLFGTLQFVEQGLAEDLRPLLALVGLHEGYLHAVLFEEMAKQVDTGWTRARIDRLIAALQAAGLLRDTGQAVYEIHPLLTSFLRSRGDASEPCRRAFVDVLAKLADALAPLELHEQRMPFLLHAASFHFALVLAERLSMDKHFAALTQLLANYAQNILDLPGASRLFARFAEHCAAQGNSEAAAVAFHQLGMVAQQQREFARAREWYSKSLRIKEKQGNLHGAAKTNHQLGRVAEEQREFDSAREWYLKSLSITEKQGDRHLAAKTYHHLGRVAEEQREFASAREWYIKSLAIKEKDGNLHGAAITYHQLGVLAEEERDYASAREWYVKSLKIREKQGDLRGAAINYHQLGIVSQEQRDYAKALEWYMKSLAITENRGDAQSAARTYHQLGRLAEERRDFAGAREWYLKALGIFENGNPHDAARTHHQLGRVAGFQAKFEECGQWLVRSILGFLETNAQYHAEQGMRDFSFFYRRASPEDQRKLEAMWCEAGFGELPREPNE